MQKDVKALKRKAEKQGFQFRQGRKHVRVTCPDGSFFGLSSTPAGQETWRKIVHDFTSRGLEL